MSFTFVVEEVVPADALRRVHDEHFAQDVLDLGGNLGVLGDHQGLVLDVQQKLVNVGRDIRTLAEKKLKLAKISENYLIKACADGPNVGLVVVLFTRQHLRRHIKWRAQHGLGHVVLPEHLRESKVRDLDGTIMLQNIGQLKVPMHDIVLDQRLECV